MSSPASVASAHNRYNQAVPSSSAVEGDHEMQQQQVNAEAGKHNLGKDSIVDHSVQKNAQTLKQEAAIQTGQKRQDIDQKTQSVVQKVRDEMSKSPQKFGLFDSTTRKKE